MIFSLIISWAWLGCYEEPTVDSIIDRFHQQHGIKAASVCTDHEFLRRITLDLAGRIPSENELDEFLRAPDRSEKIDQLLDSDEFPRFMADVFTAALVGYSNVFGCDREMMRIWLEDQFSEDRPYDEIAHELITARGTAALDGPANFLIRHQYDPAVKVGRMFLGVRLDCAQCHDHPFDRWTENDYQQMRSFFSQLRVRQQGGSVNVRDDIAITNRSPRPETRKMRPRQVCGKWVSLTCLPHL